MEHIGKLFLFIGLFLVLIGFLLMMFDKLPFNIGRLPGDIYIKKDNFVFYFPITTSILLSIFFSFILFIISKISK
ncbi:MAG: DUF2905 domain-containing protein [Persephonella sp.]|nr:MAG: DUF2905 domain-containing protein [Persephonella sp.]RUM61979.1 MAG: DUF2905 domain-containing protein [Persephonella sp.]